MSGIAGTLLGIVQSVGNIGDTLASGVEARLRTLRMALREEMRRISASLALSILAGCCGFAALLFGAGAILLAAWATHPVLFCALIALGFALVAILAVLLIRGHTR